MHRFFIPEEWIDGESVAIQGNLVHQLRHVLRLRKGDRILVLDNTGWEYEVELESLQSAVIRGSIRRKELAPGEPLAQITLYQALLKGDKFDLVLQKGTELGVKAFVPVISQRCVVRKVSEEHRLARWRRIIQEAAEQSRRSKLPSLSLLLPFSQGCSSAQGWSLLAWEGERRRGLKPLVRRWIKEHRKKATGTGASPLGINLFVGPEGGFTEEEVEFARSQGIITVSLGKPLLRAETASLAAVTAILYESNDLGGRPSL
jgi:16S rRNA (uracil1498-N3)-methyltransferase